MYSYDRRKVAVLKQKHREDKDRQEWALFDSKGERVLEWFGPEKPSDERVQKAEARVQFFKNKGASVVMVEHAYGQWKDALGRWAIERRRGETETFVARDLKHGWDSEAGSLSEAVEALTARSKGEVSFQMQVYSYDRQGSAADRCMIRP